MGKFIVEVFTVYADKKNEILKDLTEIFETEREAVVYAKEILMELEEDGVKDKYNATVTNNDRVIVYDSSKVFLKKEAEEKNDLEVNEMDITLSEEKRKTAKNSKMKIRIKKG
ncbi:MAG: hypothetical protein JXR81_06300 [Candidatus Goldbacteria bacterium]|nr:hypothetical protein [Candidatus Goldiibacteriota bacterium]